MYKNYFFHNYKVYILPGFLIAIAVFLGSLCCCTSSSYEELNIYLTNFFSSIRSINKFNVSIGNLDEILFIFFAIFFSAFLKLGILINSFVVLRRSFVIGYTLTAFLKVFGSKGILAVGAMLPEIILFVSALILFSGIAMTMSLKKNEKNFFIFFIFFSVFIGTIFCGLSFFNGYFTTTFMDAISFKFG